MVQRLVFDQAQEWGNSDVEGKDPVEFCWPKNSKNVLKNKECLVLEWSAQHFTELLTLWKNRGDLFVSLDPWLC